MSLLRGQADVSPQVPMPVDRVDDASITVSIAAEVVTWLYVNSGAWASATGQAAGTIVLGNLAYRGVLNATKGAIGSFNTTSVVLAAATRFNSRVSIPEAVLSELQVLSPVDQKAKVSLYLTTNGQYAIDHRRGQIWGIAKDTVADDTMAYSYASPMSTTTGSSTNVTQLAGQTLKQGVTNASSVVTGEQNVLPEAIYRTTPLSKIDGQVSPIESDSAGNKKITQATWERGADLSFDLIKVQNRATKSVPITASALVFTGAGQLMGWVVNSCSAGATVKVWDNTSAATTVAFDTMTYTAAVNQGPAVVPLKDVQFTTGCYFTLSGTISLTPLFNQL